jgi:MoxR-like ATPase
LALIRGRDYVLPTDARDLVKDAFRHRLVLSYDALMDDVTADFVLDKILERTPIPTIELGAEVSA